MNVIQGTADFKIKNMSYLKEQREAFDYIYKVKKLMTNPTSEQLERMTEKLIRHNIEFITKNWDDLDEDYAIEKIDHLNRISEHVDSIFNSKDLPF